MPSEWKETDLLKHITDQIEESLTLDYKAAGALDRQNDKKTEITKDVSAMANSDGGTIIYGMREFGGIQKHLPEKLDPIDRTKFSKEWLEQIINSVRPRILDVVVHPVQLSSGASDVVYVVEVPKGTTAHQARDHKYYRRFNFESVSMEDHEIRDVMNRKAKSNADIIFGFRRHASLGEEKHFLLLPKAINLGESVIHHFKLRVVMPRQAAKRTQIVLNRPDLLVTYDAQQNHVIDYHSSDVLFPEEERDIGEIMQWVYAMNEGHRLELRQQELAGNPLLLSWVLYADDMTPKPGTYPMQQLHDL